MKKIVIIEDDTDAQEAYQQLLAERHYRAFFGTTAQLGLQLIRTEKPDLIILDIMLPGNMSGMDVLASLKHYPALKHIPVLAVTNLQSEREHALSAGATEVLIKTATSLETLMNHIEAYLKTGKGNEK